MANLNNLIVTGMSRFLNDIHINNKNTIINSEFFGSNSYSNNLGYWFFGKGSGTTELNIIPPSSYNNSLIFYTGVSGANIIGDNWDGTGCSDLKMAVTDARTVVKQTNTSTGSSEYKLLFSGTADSTDRTEGVRKHGALGYAPGNNMLSLYNNAFTTVIRLQANNSPSLYIKDSTTKKLTLTNTDVTLTDTTWDGTNTSLKSAIGAKANAASPTITGNMTMSNGSISMSHNGSIIGLSAIELYCPSTSGNHGGFIDFHWNQNTADYTARLIETGSKGTIKAYNSISNASDRRLKDNIVDIDDKYVGLLNIINAKQYNFKSSEDKIDLGFIAQEVEDGMKQIGIADDKMPIISKPTDNDVDKYYGLDYSQMTALLWKICQVQQKEIDELKNK